MALGQRDVPDFTKETDVEMMITTDYWRCGDCGRESLRRGALERSEFHAEGCALR